MKLKNSIIVGLSFVAAGAVIILSNIGVISADIKRIIISWPMLCAVFGVLALSNKDIKSGLILLIIGGFFMLPLIPSLELGKDFTHNFWPLMLVIVGLIILFTHHNKKERKFWCWRIKQSDSKAAPKNTPKDTPKNSSDITHESFEQDDASFENNSRRETYSSDGFIKQNFFFNGSDQIFSEPVFRGGRIITVFGGTNLDLTQSNLPEGENAVLTIRGLCGGAVIKVPHNWKVEIRNVSILGGAADSRVYNSEPKTANKLILNIECILGGVQIK